MDRHIFLCVFVCLWTVQITGLYGEFIEEISTGHDFGLKDVPRAKRPLSDYSCSVKHVKAGCFNDKRNPSSRAMNELLFQDRYKGKGFSGQRIDWESYDSYLPDLVCRCATAAANKGYSFFGIQFYGECWSAADAAQRFNIYSKSDKCVDTEYKVGCDTIRNKPCAGVAHVNFVYQIVPGDNPDGSGVGPPINPEEY
ncbi:uncharacterized protein [Pocillopora verrucosa]|uniref:uncharacterized protein n=1 Tax=Pocillopora verrucosa TaxID=203993 RepID=UPI0027971A40|nr:uncharacterized protein LOC131793672 [Pocillopora verrucosa]